MKRNLVRKLAFSRWSRPAALALALAAVSGCGTTSSRTPDIRGAWYFAYVQSGSNLPPTFDVMEFDRGDRLRLQSRLYGYDFTGTYTNVGENLALSFHVPARPEPVEVRLRTRLSNGSQELVVSDGNQELAYCRKNRLLGDDLASEWTATVAGEKLTMVLAKDGGYQVPASGVAGYYRLWRSNRGPTMTTVFTVLGKGAFSTLQTYERKGDQLTLVPFDASGPQTDKPIVFTRSK